MRPNLHADFELRAAPICWYEVATNLNHQAKLLYADRSGTTTLTNHHRGTSITTATANRGTFLLAGFALENLLKAFLVYENPIYISNGKLANPLKTHSLTNLRAMATLVPYRDRYNWVLKAFEDGLESWARYPCATTAAVDSLEKTMTPRLWISYGNLFMSHAKRMRKLLTNTWTAPSGESYTARFTGTA
jgi:hypothetical protein